MTNINNISDISGISDTGAIVTRADPLGQPLSTPLGTEHIAPVPALPRLAPPVFVAEAADADTDTAPSNRAGLLTKIFASTSVLLLLGVGLYAWLR